MKNCKHCSNEFEQRFNKGSEQIYCSTKCRNAAAQTRLINKLKNEVNEGQFNFGEVDNGKTQSLLQQSQQSQHIGNSAIVERQSNDNGRNFSGNSDNLYNAIRETFDAKNEVIFYKLKCESLEKENQQLKQDVINLEMELDEAEQEPEENSFISGIVTQFKQEPQATVQFASELINNWLKPKQ
jgi:hypothetical protein